MGNKTILEDVKYILEVDANIISKDGKIKFVGEDDRGYVFYCDYREAVYFNTVVEASDFKFDLIKKFKINPIYVKIKTIKTEIY